MVPDGLAPGDGAELAYGMKYFAPVHPPGYPLYLLLGHSFVDALGLDFVTGPHYFSAFLMALSLSLLYIFFRRRSISPLLSLVTVMVLGVSPPIWGIAVQTEVYALLLVFFAGTLICWDYVNREGHGHLFLWFFVGLSLTHHPLGILNIPLAIQATLSGHSRREVLRPFILFVTPVLLYLTLLVPSSGFPFNWPEFTRFPELFGHMTGGSFTRFFFADGGWTPLIQLKRMALGHFAVFPFVLLIPLAVGYFSPAGRERFLIKFQVIFLIVLSVYGVPDITDFLVPSYALSGLVLARGMESLKTRLTGPVFGIILLLCLGSVVAFSVISGMTYNRQSPYEEYVQRIDRTVDRGTLVSDWSHYTPIRFYQLDRDRLSNVRLVALPPGYDLEQLIVRHHKHDIPLYSTVRDFWTYPDRYQLKQVGKGEGLYRFDP